jgi:hypothetical protein
MLSKITLCLFCFLLFAGGSLSARGQEANAPPSATPDPELVKLKNEIALEKARTDLAEQKKRTLAARLPDAGNDPANKTLKGEINVEDKASTFEIESVALSYEALSIIAKQISGNLQSGLGDFNQVVIYNEPDFKTLVQYRIFESQAVPALDAYEFLLTTDPAKRGAARGLSRGIGSEILQLPTIGTSFVKSAIDFISLFRTDTTITNKKVTIEETALGALVASEMRSLRPNFKVYFPKAYLPDNDWEPADEGSVLTQLTKLYSYQEVAKGIIADYTATIPAEKQKHPYHQQIPALTALNEQVGRLLAAYENNKGETATNRLSDLVRAESLNQMLTGDPKTGILQLKVLDAGGSERTTRNLILGSKIKHSGSAIVEYLLFDKNGLLRASEVLYHHTGFQKMETARSPRD